MITNEERIHYIRGKREALGFIQEDMARALGISTRTYTRLENGKCKVRRLHILAVDQLCEVETRSKGVS